MTPALAAAEARPGPRQAPTAPWAGVVRIAREHAPVVGVLVLALALRVGVAIAYRPALLWDDSWEYLDLAWGQSFVAFQVDHPSGYPAIIWLLSLPGRSLLAIVALQHLAGLLAGGMVYALLGRLGVRHWIAALATALVVLDGYAIALEEYVMAEAFFGLALMGSVYAAIVLRHRPLGWALSGLLLAAATTMRTAALFALPVWFAYMLWVRPARRHTIAALATLAVPLLAYSALHAGAGRGFGMTQGEGWFLYGRAGPIIDCRGVRVSATEARLCDVAYGHWSKAGGEQRWSPTDYTDNPLSPAARMFGDMYTPDVNHSSRVLGDFAVRMIRHRPGAYLRMVGDDFLAYFDPNGGGKESVETLPARGQQDAVDPETKARLLPRYRRPFHAPYKLVRAYQRAVYTPVWLLGGFAFVAVLAVALGMLRRVRRSLTRRPEIFLLAGTALSMLAGTVLTSSMFVRYLLPAVPLFVCAGLLALSDLHALAGRRPILPKRTST